MKTQTKHFKIIVSLVLLILAVLSFVNVSYSYFTTTSSVDGSIGMGDMNVSFLYQENGVAPTRIKNSITLISSTGLIERGNAFGLKIYNESQEKYVEIEDLSILNEDGSCDVYVRFWIEAYVVRSGTVDTTKDYGRFFFLTRIATVSGVNNFTRSETEPYCYYIEQSLPEETSLSLGK